MHSVGSHFKCMRPVQKVLVWIQPQAIALCCRVQIWKDLRVTDENVDVEAFTMIYLKHKSGAAAKTPAIEKFKVRVRLVDIDTDWSKNFFPIGSSGQPSGC